jgi:hypothetical protein
MTPLIIGLILLVAVLVYHIIFNKEGFENPQTFPSEITEAMTTAIKNMPEDKLNKFEEKLDTVGAIEDSSKQLYMSLNAMEDLRAYYTYPKFSFDVFLVRFLDSVIVNAKEEEYIKMTNEDIKVVLSEINRLKMVANITDEMPSEKLLKTTLEASAAKEAEKKARLEKKRLEKEKAKAEELINDTSASASLAPPAPSPSIKQGAEFNAHRCEPPCPNVCDSDDYIRKDSIPCWNCNLPRSD